MAEIAAGRGAASAVLGLLGIAAIVAGLSGAARRANLEEEYVVISPGRWGGEVRGGMRQARLVALWGGQGKVTTGTSVDGRKTVPGLQTDCIPGVLSSDCSPAQVRSGTSPFSNCSRHKPHPTVSCPPEWSHSCLIQKANTMGPQPSVHVRVPLQSRARQRVDRCDLEQPLRGCPQTPRHVRIRCTRWSCGMERLHAIVMLAGISFC